MLVSNKQVVDRCLNEAIAATRDDRRTQRRYPFFRPITITVGDESWPAFCRDISRGGMGLLHDQFLEPGRTIKVTLPTRAEHLHLAGEVKWCSHAGEECYLGGVSFRNLAVGTSLALLSEVIREEVSRRMQQRYPFFRPITIRGGHASEQTAFCRDISRGGMGLLHRRPITPGRAIMTISDAEGEHQELSLEIRWCLPSAQDWYLSGAKFASVWLEEVPAKLM